MISIFTPGDKRPYIHYRWKWFWQAAFHDVDVFSESERYWPITIPQAASLFNFIQMFEARGIKEVHVHCDAGISRSAGVARFVADYYGGDFPNTYNHYNKTVYSSLVEQQRICEGANVSYEELWK